MVSKIELYREVLDIEPNSKVFFPLARQLSEEGRQDEAVVVLQRGIGFHPDHLEAKFLLLEILTRQGREEQADAVFADVGAMLSRYPSVWLLWSKNAAARAKDPSLAMLFLAHYFQKQTLTWAEVMERGLQSLSDVVVPNVATTETISPQSTTPLASAATGPVSPARNVPPVVSVAPGSPIEKEEDDVPPLRGAREVMELADILEDTPGEKVTKTRSSKNREPAVQTKTMAALLAGQGDIAGALEIYNTLLAAAAPGPEREELLGLIEALPPATEAGQAFETLPEEPAVQSTEAVSPTADANPKGATKLVNLLDTLAGRLEARAGT